MDKDQENRLNKGDSEMENMKHTLNSILESIFAMLKPLSKEEKRQAGIISASDYQKQKREEK